MPQRYDVSPHEQTLTRAFSTGAVISGSTLALLVGLLFLVPPSHAQILSYDAELATVSPSDTTIVFQLSAGETNATTHVVPAGESIQTAIDSALNGDVILLESGTYEGDIDFVGKGVRIIGRGRSSVIKGSGGGSVVTFTNGEGNDSVLDSVVITGGSASSGGGIYIDSASPTIIRSFITANQASSRGSGIYIKGGSFARLYNNEISFNTRTSGDPHGIQIASSSPTLINNSVIRHDSNGIHVSGSSDALLMNNIFAYNGAIVGGSRRGRGLCDFSGIALAYNNFYGNRVSALLRGGRDWARIEAFQSQNDFTDVTGNEDGRPSFLRRPGSRVQASAPGQFQLRRDRRSNAYNRGNPTPSCNDHDGTRNDIGHTGGPFAAGSLALPSPGICDEISEP